MLRFLVVLFMFSFFASRAKAGPSDDYPALTVDDAHLQMQQPEDAQPPFYTLAAGPGVVLDASAYRFQIPPELAVAAPDSVQVLIGQGRQYACSWHPQQGRQVLDATSLTPTGSSAPFTGFKAGDTVVFGIGHSRTDGHTLQFSVIWVGMARVR